MRKQKDKQGLAKKSMCICILDLMSGALHLHENPARKRRSGTSQKDRSGGGQHASYQNLKRPSNPHMRPKICTTISSYATIATLLQTLHQWTDPITLHLPSPLRNMNNLNTASRSRFPEEPEIVSLHPPWVASSNS